jgi:hypothetical protein
MDQIPRRAPVHNPGLKVSVPVVSCRPEAFRIAILCPEVRDADLIRFQKRRYDDLVAVNYIYYIARKSTEVTY